MIFSCYKFYSLDRYDLIYNVMSFYLSHKFMIKSTLKTLFYQQPVDLFSSFNCLYYSPQSKNTIGFFLHLIIYYIFLNMI